MLPFSQTLLKQNLCIIITLHGVCIFIVGLMTLNVSRSQVCVLNIDCKLCFLESFLLHIKCCMFVTYIWKFMLSMNCVTDVCVQGR